TRFLVIVFRLVALLSVAAKLRATCARLAILSAPVSPIRILADRAMRPAAPEPRPDPAALLAASITPAPVPPRVEWGSALATAMHPHVRLFFAHAVLRVRFLALGFTARFS